VVYSTHKPKEDTAMKYYRYYIEKEFKNSIYETEKAIGFDICDSHTYIQHSNTGIAWFPKSQMIIEESENQIDYFIPEWLFRKNHLRYHDFDGINTYKNYIEEK
jgi:hypothetical protein